MKKICHTLIISIFCISVQGGFCAGASASNAPVSAAELSIHRILDEFKPERAVVMIAAAEAHDLLAIATYDGVEVLTGDSARAVAGAITYEPGSVIAPFIVARGIERGLISASSAAPERVEVLSYLGQEVALPLDHAKYGPEQGNWLDLILKRSSNNYITRLALFGTPEEFYDDLHSWGFGQSTGWHEAESEGVLPLWEEWETPFPVTLPMGHDIATTPLQIVKAYCHLANPKENSPVSEETAAAVRRGMHASEEGTARRAMFDGLNIAAKTGTTRLSVDGENDEPHYAASCVGIFQVEDLRYVVYVLLDKPKVNGVPYGGKVAAPLVADLADLARMLIDF